MTYTVSSGTLNPTQQQQVGPPKSEMHWHNTYGISKGYSRKFLTYPRSYLDSPNRSCPTVSHLLWPRLLWIDAGVIFPNSSPKFHMREIPPQFTPEFRHHSHFSGLALQLHRSVANLKEAFNGQWHCLSSYQILYRLVPPNCKNPLRKGPHNGRQLQIMGDLHQLSVALTDFVKFCTTTQFTAHNRCHMSKPEPEIQSPLHPTGRPPVTMPCNCRLF